MLLSPTLKKTRMAASVCLFALVLCFCAALTRKQNKKESTSDRIALYTSTTTAVPTTDSLEKSSVLVNRWTDESAAAAVSAERERTSTEQIDDDSASTQPSRTASFSRDVDGPSTSNVSTSPSFVRYPFGTRKPSEAAAANLNDRILEEDSSESLPNVVSTSSDSLARPPPRRAADVRAQRRLEEQAQAVADNNSFSAELGFVDDAAAASNLESDEDYRGSLKRKPSKSGECGHYSYRNHVCSS
jgi:hypothetical protein